MADGISPIKHVAMKFSQMINEIRVLITLALVLTFGLSAFTLVHYPSSVPPEIIVEETLPGTTENTALLDHPGRLLFVDYCNHCHQVNTQLVGPALNGVTDRRSEDWILKMVKNSGRLIQSQDPTAVALYEQFNKTPMPRFDYLSNEEILSILDYVKKASQ